MTTHPHSIAVCGAFAEGCGWRLRQPHEHTGGPIAAYGRLRGCNEMIERAKAEGRDWWLIDRGYFRASRDADYTGYFRITRSAMQHDGAGVSDGQRFGRLRLHLRDWRTSGSHVLVCPPTDIFGRLSGFDAQEWTRRTLLQLAQVTDRELRVREKPRGAVQGPKTPLSADLRDCWALVTHSSNAAVEALVLGVPVFCTDPCAAQRMGRSDLSLIEDPLYPIDRHPWASVLADNQFLLSEMRSGLAWRMLNA